MIFQLDSSPQKYLKKKQLRGFFSIENCTGVENYISIFSLN